MADYEACWRTSYFRVKDVEAFREEMDSVLSGEVQFFVDDGSGKLVLGGYGSVPAQEEDEEAGLPEIIRKHLAEGEQAEVGEIGHEKLRHLVAYKWVITKDRIKTIDASVG